jgi:hypothetical protein
MNYLKLQHAYAVTFIFMAYSNTFLGSMIPLKAQ